MKKILQLTVLLLLVVVQQGFAQDRQVKGKVTDASDGSGLPGVAVKVKGSTRGTVTDVEGNYKINVGDKGVLVFSSVGFGTKEMPVGSASEINVGLTESTSSIDEVVVTALGISRDKKALGYSVQKIDGKDLTVARETNVVNSLAGRIAGVVINRTTGGPGSSSRVVIRGERSLLGNSQPLYVVDGVPINNSQPGQSGEFGGSDAGDGIGNLNPDDIESMDVLKGGAAAALYGSLGQNGVIMITTKKGAASKGLGVTYGLNFTSDSPMTSRAYQNKYAQGNTVNTNGVFSLNYLPNAEGTWGPLMTGQTVKDWAGRDYALSNQDHAKAFFQSANAITHSLSVSGGNAQSQVYFSATNLNNNGLVPNNNLNRTSMTLRLTHKMSEKLSMDAKVNYIYQNIVNRPQGGEDAGNVFSDILRMPVNIPTSTLQDYEIVTGGRPSPNFFTSTLLMNPYFLANRIRPEEIRNRFIGLLSTKYQFTPDLFLQLRGGLDTYFDNNERKVFAGTPAFLSNNTTNGDYRTDTRRVSILNGDFLLAYKKNISKDLSLGLTAGGNIRKDVISSSIQSAGGLDIANFFSVVNGLNRTNSQNYEPKEVQSLYGTGQLGYKEMLYLDLTARNDWSSTLPANAWSYFYPSVTVSGILSNMFQMPEAISFAKLRGAWVEVGNDTDPFRTAQYLVAANGVGGTILTNNTTLTIGQNLKSERTRNIELGADIRFLQNRIGLDFTYYKSNSFNQLGTLPLSPTSGFTAKFVNFGNIQNEGIEIVLNADVTKTKDFSWKTLVNYARNRNTVVELDPEGKILNYSLGNNRIASISAKNGDRIGELFVKGFLRDEKGNVLVNSATGLPITNPSQIYIGNANPDFTLGWVNTFTYKGIKLDVLIDGRFGGKVVSHTEARLSELGLAERTLEGREGTYITKGVKATLDGTTWKSTGVDNDIKISAQSYWASVGARGAPVGEAFAYDADNIRLRQLTLSYSLPKALISKTPFKSVSASVFGRNLFFLSKSAPFDPEIALNTGLNGQGIDFYSLPTTRQMGFSLNVGF
jgi:TonB-linked SusC/RagA family outer membrane protein